MKNSSIEVFIREIIITLIIFIQSWRAEPIVTHKVFLDIDVHGGDKGRIEIGLFGKIVPKTVENFRSLCTCDKGAGKVSGAPLCYRDTKIHRILPNFIIQSGDITHNNGLGGESIYGGNFDDETFFIKHNKLHLVSMANKGPNSNGSQFFINTVKTAWLDGLNVAFGIVLKGIDFVAAIEMLGTNSGIPQFNIVISDCGEIQMWILGEDSCYWKRVYFDSFQLSLYITIHAYLWY